MNDTLDPLDSSDTNDAPSDWKFRERVIPNYGLLLVPNYVVRIDKSSTSRSERAGTDEGGAKRSGHGGSAHGWQVRYTKPFAFFPDSLTDSADGPGTPADSLDLASTYLMTIWRGPLRLLNPKGERSDKKIVTGCAGVMMNFRNRQHASGIYQICEIRVNAVDGTVMRYLYVGHVQRITLQRLHAVLSAARALRRTHMEELGLPFPPVEPFDEKTALMGTPLEHLVNPDLPKPPGAVVAPAAQKVAEAVNRAMKRATRKVAE